MNKRFYVPEFIYHPNEYGKSSPWVVKQEHIDEALNLLFTRDYVYKSELEEIYKNPAALISALRHNGKFVIGKDTIIKKKPKPPQGLRYDGKKYSATYALKSKKYRPDLSDHTGEDENDAVYIGYTIYFITREEKLKTEFRRDKQVFDYGFLLDLNQTKRLAKAAVKNSVKHGKKVDDEDRHNSGLSIPQTYAGTSDFQIPLNFHGEPFAFPFNAELQHRDTDFQDDK
ncbi:hypothetical protein DOC35_19490 [Salmonella enterica subsp. enterica]|nr:hypothetical protein [Salmonella enterica subsp. enterica]